MISQKPQTTQTFLPLLIGSHAPYLWHRNCFLTLRSESSMMHAHSTISPPTCSVHQNHIQDSEGKKIQEADTVMQGVRVENLESIAQSFSRASRILTKEFDRCLKCTPCGNQIINDEHSLTLLHSSYMHLYPIRSILQGILLANHWTCNHFSKILEICFRYQTFNKQTDATDALKARKESGEEVRRNPFLFTWQFVGLANRHKLGTNAQCDRWPKYESTSFNPCMSKHCKSLLNVTFFSWICKSPPIGTFSVQLIDV